jgi:sterol desaturase/sphingolipid hydroxylase (fatty acid hydroxylase superfamily)
MNRYLIYPSMFLITLCISRIPYSSDMEHNHINIFLAFYLSFWITGFSIWKQQKIKLSHFILIHFNHITLAFSIFFYGTISTNYGGFIITFMEVVGMYIIFDFAFYIGHRILHTPFFYAKYHKLHHTTKADFGITGSLMDPIDFAIESIIPSILASYFIQSSYTSCMIFAALGGFNVVWSHSGLDFKYMPPTDDHFEHHKIYDKNFGLGLSDLIIYKATRIIKWVNLNVGSDYCLF